MTPLPVSAMVLVVLGVGTPAPCGADGQSGTQNRGTKASRYEQSAPQILGLVELPRVWGPDGALVDPHVVEPPVIVYSAPTTTSAVVARIQLSEDIESREHGYEENSAVVYGIEQGWHRVNLRSGKYGWLPPAEAGTFRSVEQLLSAGLAHVTDAWDGFLAAAPSTTAQRRRSPRPARDSISVIEIRRTGDTLWIRIAVLNPGHCEAAQPRPVATGWIPAYAPSGALTVWFYSRGC
jgi:hypothetical protein